MLGNVFWFGWIDGGNQYDVGAVLGGAAKWPERKWRKFDLVNVSKKQIMSFMFPNFTFFY